MNITTADPRLTALRWRHVYSGKVRDLYESDSEPGRMLVVASDRVSAFDHVLEPGIPGKGALLTRLSLWWFARLGLPDHLASGHPSLGAHLPPDIAERAMLVHTLDMFPIEAVVRGYLVGSGWAEYQESQSVCGIPLPAGLSNGDRLPEPIYTPAFKAPAGEHDENISFERTVELIGETDAAALRDASLTAFATGSDDRRRARAHPGRHQVRVRARPGRRRTHPRRRGAHQRLQPVLGCRGLCRRVESNRMDSFDKQIVRNWLSANWDKTGTPPRIPDEIVEQTAGRYRELIDRLTA